MLLAHLQQTTTNAAHALATCESYQRSLSTPCSCNKGIKLARCNSYEQEDTRSPVQNSLIEHTKKQLPDMKKVCLRSKTKHPDLEAVNVAANRGDVVAPRWAYI